MTVRPWRFARSLLRTRRQWLRSPVVWHNVRAVWIQSDPDWLSKLEPIELTDEEYERFMEAIRS